MKNMIPELYRELRTLNAQTFPKQCACCGQHYETLEEFIAKTKPVNETSGLAKFDEGEEPGVGMFRNCDCGSTLFIVCADRRDTSPTGMKRRELFDKIVHVLTDAGIDGTYAREQVRKAMRGEKELTAILEEAGIRL